MKKILFLIFLLLCLVPDLVSAKKGCCSHHGGVVGCSSSGRQICADGTLSPSCTCEPTPIYGCTDPDSINYNSNANNDDGTCVKKKFGCVDSKAVNYDVDANISDSSCKYLETQVENKTIKYKTIVKYNDKKSNDYQLITQIGQNGKKEITYEILKDENGKIVSKNIYSEKIITEAIDEIIEKGTTGSLPVGRILWLLFGIIIPIYNIFLNKNSNTIFGMILNKSGKIRIIYYLIYYIFVIPLFIDVIIILVDLYKKFCH